MNIGIVFTAQKSSGGAYQYSLNIIEALKLVPQHNYFVFNFSPEHLFSIVGLKNWKIIDLCSKRRNNSIKKREKLNWKQLIFETVHRLKLYKIKIYLVEQNSKRKLQKFYNYNLDLVFYPLISEFSYLLKIPSVIAVHDINHRLHPEFPELSKGGQYVTREHLYRRALKVARYVLVDSKISKEDVTGYYRVANERVIVLPFVPPVEYLKKNVSKEEVSRFLNKYNLPKRFIFYPAQFWPHKNHRNLIKALGILKKKDIIIPLALVGSKREEWGEFDRVVRTIKENGLEDNVYYLGYVDDREISILYKLAVALVMPVLVGPTYIPVIEAWYMNCPVLYSDIRGCKQQASDAALLFNPRDPEDLAEKIEMIWKDEGLRKELINKGEKRFNNWTNRDFNKRISQIINNFEKK